MSPLTPTIEPSSNFFQANMVKAFSFDSESFIRTVDSGGVCVLLGSQ